MKSQNKAYFYTGLSIIFWATVATAFKISLRSLTPIQLLFVSSGSSLLVLGLLALFTGKMKLLTNFTNKDVGFSAFMGLINPFGYYLILFEAYDLLPAQIVQPLNCTWGIVIVFLSIPILKQKVSLFNVLTLLISFTGVSIIAYGGEVSKYHNVSLLGVVLALSTSFIWSLYWLINARDNKDELMRLFLNFLFGFIYILIFILVSGSLREFNFVGLFPAIYVGIFEMGLTFWFWLQALRFSKNTAKISIYIYLFPILSLGIIYLFLDEKILVTSVVGLILVITGVVLNKVLD